MPLWRIAWISEQHRNKAGVMFAQPQHFEYRKLEPEEVYLRDLAITIPRLGINRDPITTPMSEFSPVSAPNSLSRHPPPPQVSRLGILYTPEFASIMLYWLTSLAFLPLIGKTTLLPMGIWIFRRCLNHNMRSTPETFSPSVSNAFIDRACNIPMEWRPRPE